MKQYFNKISRRKFIKYVSATLSTSLIPFVGNEGTVFGQQPKALKPKPTTKYDWKPGVPNQPIGVAKGIYPGRVAWAHAPGAAHWSGK